MSLLKEKIKSLELEDYALVAFICTRAVTWLFTSVIGPTGVFASMLLMLALYVAIIIKKIRRKETSYIVVFFIIAVGLTLLALISAIGDRSRLFWLLDMDNGLIVKVFDPRKGIFALFLFLMIDDFDRILNDLRLAAYILFAYLTLHVILFLAVGNWGHYFSIPGPDATRHQYNMHLGYDYILCFLLFEDLYVNKDDRLAKVLALFSLFFAVYFGSRGILLVVAGYYVLQFLFHSDREKKKKVALSLVMSLVFVVGATLAFEFIQGVLSQFYPVDLVEEAESGSRTVDALVSGEISNSNGRWRLWGYSLDAIKDSPIVGHGLFGDRPYVGRGFRWGYSHNVILELMASFGLFGLAFALWIFYKAFHYLLRKDASASANSLIIILLASCVKLLVSDSFLFLNYFWMFVGYMMIDTHLSNRLRLKPLMVTASTLLLANVAGLAYLIQVEASRQVNRSYVPKKPTVVLLFEGTYDTDYETAYKFLEEKGMVGTSFISGGLVDHPGYLSSAMIQEMAASGWDFQDNLYYQENILMETTNQTMKSIERSNEFFEKLNLNTPQVVASYHGGVDETKQPTMLEERHLFLESAFSMGDGSYSRLTPYDLLHLQAYKPRISEGNAYRTLSSLKRELEEVSENGGIFLIDFREFQREDPLAMNHLYYFKKIIREIDRFDFEYRTLAEIAEEVKVEEKDKNVKGWLKNLDIKGYVN